jgi:hypothetical protein
MFRLEVGGWSHQAICPLQKELHVWQLNPEGLGSLWLNASATSGQSFWLKAYMIGGRQAVPLLSYTLAFALKLWKSTENHSQCSQMMSDNSRCVNLAALLGAASTDLLSISHLRLTWAWLRAADLQMVHSVFGDLELLDWSWEMGWLVTGAEIIGCIWWMVFTKWAHLGCLWGQCLPYITWLCPSLAKRWRGN